MSIAIAQQAGRYIYGIVRASDAQRLMHDRPLGINDAELTIITAGSIAAVISPSEVCRLRPQRKLLAAHQRVIEWISSTSSMLPVAFGLIADSQDDVVELILKHQDVLSQQLEAVDGRVEMTVSLNWTAENIFQFFVERNEDLQAARNRVVNGIVSRDEMIAVGQLFDTLQQQERERLSQKVIDGFQGIIVDVEQQNPKDESQILRASFLISREDVNIFENRVYEIARNFDENFSFSFNGPWPPYSFVKLNLAGD